MGKWFYIFHHHKDITSTQKFHKYFRLFIIKKYVLVLCLNFPIGR